jgi:hypothetical protein
MGILQPILERKKPKIRNFLRLRLWTGSYSYVLLSIMFIAERYCIEILRLKISFSPRRIQWSLETLAYQKFLKALVIMLWLFKEHHIICRQKFAKISHILINQIFGLLDAFSMSFVPWSTHFMPRIYLDLFIKLFHISKSQSEMDTLRNYRSLLIYY